MKNQLIYILKNFNKKELYSFQTYLNSWYPRKKQQQQLLSYLTPFHPLFTSKKLTREVIHKNLFNTSPKATVTTQVVITRIEFFEILL